MFGEKFIRCIAVTMIFMAVLTGCAKTEVPQDTDAEIEEQMPQAEGESAEAAEDTLQMPDEPVGAIVGTWENAPDPEREWMTSYKTCFSPDGRAVHYGFRNVDFGTWTQDGDVYTVYFDDCSYLRIDGGNHHVPSYTLTCRLEVSEDGEKKILHRDTERETEIPLEVETWDGIERYTAVDLDDYGCPLSYESGLSEIHEDASDYYSGFAEHGDLLKQGLLEIAGLLAEGKETEQDLAALPGTLREIGTYDFTGDGREEILVNVLPLNIPVIFDVLLDDYKEAVYIISPAGDGSYSILAENTEFEMDYIDILADGTELLSSNYCSYFFRSWKSGVRYHLGYREGEIVVDRVESYDWRQDYPMINYVNDFKNGVFYVYVARTVKEGQLEQYGRYIDLEDSIKIYEEKFEPVFLPFTGCKPGENDYSAVYFVYPAFPETWWMCGGIYPEEGESLVTDWVTRAKNDDPDEMLREAVEKSGYEMEKKAYPWTDETKENVIGLLRCPVADYYYISEDYVAYYTRGNIYFDEIEVAGSFKER